MVTVSGWGVDLKYGNLGYVRLLDPPPSGKEGLQIGISIPQQKETNPGGEYY